MKKISKESSVTFVELPSTQNGSLNGDLSYDIYSRFRLPSRAIHVLEAVLKNLGWRDVKSINPIFHGKRGKLNGKNFDRIFNSEILGISAITRTSPQSIELAKLYKLKNPEGIVIAGGPDPTARTEEWLRYADIVVRGEGEKTLIELFRVLEGSSDLKDVKGISFKLNGNIFHNDKRELMTSEELSNLPHPYYNEETRSRVYASVIETARGCPNDCDFCSVTQTYGRRYRNKSIKYVLEELRRTKGIGKVTFFTADNLAGSEENVIELLKAIVDSGLQTKGRSMQAQVTVKAAKNPRLLNALRKAGIDTLYVGFESNNDDTLRDLNKPYTAKENDEAAKTFRKYGFWLHGMMMPGGDGDTPESLNKMSRWINENLDSVQLFPPTPFPGTRFFEKMKKEGRILTDDYSLYDAQHVVIRPKNFSPYELQLRVNKMYKDFYSFKFGLSRLRKSPKLKPALTLMAYFLLKGKKVLYDNQSRQHLIFLKSVS